MSDPHAPIRPFYMTLPSPCPYLPGQTEQRVVAEMRRRGDDEVFNHLSEAGFRRSMGWLYRPACPTCQACVPVRIPAASFNWTRNFRKIVNRNNDVTWSEGPATYDAEHFALFRRYIASRHGDGGMASMGEAEYREMLENAPSNTVLVSFRDSENRLVAASITDRMRNGLSGVYKYFDPDEERRSLGTYAILWHVRRCIELEVDHVYLGYWIANCRKMSYKTRFRPLERMSREGWVSFESEDEAGS
ncbi:MAG: arginyltransferase [Geminicoccaceae bacterium]